MIIRILILLIILTIIIILIIISKKLFKSFIKVKLNKVFDNLNIIKKFYY